MKKFLVIIVMAMSMLVMQSCGTDIPATEGVVHSVEYIGSINGDYRVEVTYVYLVSRRDASNNAYTKSTYTFVTNTNYNVGDTIRIR